MDYLVFLSFGFAGEEKKAAEGTRLEESCEPEIVEVSWIITNPTSLEVVCEEQHFCKCAPEIMAFAVKQGILPEKSSELDTGLSDALASLGETLSKMIISQNLKSRLVTFGANQFRVGFNKEASAKAAQIPSYLKRCQLFDINQEVPKWLGARLQGKYEKFSLTGLANSLNIVHGPIATALDDCHLMVKIMASILSSTDSKDLFVKLADMTVDYEQFIDDESRVVLLCGLSPKITQPELMLWFSDQGLKPIRLLTVQNQSTGVSSGVCQAIFASHSEAKRAFALNMKPFNERVIEVSPSSQSFSATVHLTPLPTFAPAEKHPQPSVTSTPGTYSYSYSSNNGSYSDNPPAPGVSSMSQFSHKANPPPPPSFHNSTRSYGSGDKGSYSPHDPYVPNNHFSNNHHHHHPPVPKTVPGDWTCPSQGCNTYNYAFRLNCYKCFCVKPQSGSNYSSGHSASGHRHQPTYQPNYHHNSPYPAPDRMRGGNTSRPGDWFCPNSACGFENFASRVACLRCATENPLYKVAPHTIPNPVPMSSTGFRQGDWICPTCSSHNFASRYACMRCSGPRPQSAMGSAITNNGSNGMHHPHPHLPPSGGSSQQPLLAGDWLCRHNNCGFHNFAKRQVCGRCGAPAGL